MYFLDSTEKHITITSFTTTQDVCDEILSMVGIDTVHLKEFNLYEVSGEYGKHLMFLFTFLTYNNTERSLWPEERICDIVSKWEIYKKTIAGTGVNVSFSLLFKQQIFLMDEQVEIADISILGYHQVTHNDLWNW